MAKAKEHHPAIVVFTADRVEEILAQGGSGDWVLSPEKANRCAYLVCCRKETWSNRKDGVPHGAAFLVGLVSGVHERPESSNERGQSRFVIQFSEYASINQPKVWKEGRNPVSYRSLEDLGIQLKTLEFKPLPPPPVPIPGPAKPMTIAEAKKALAETYGVSPDKVEITIRG